ncbi:MAG: hypothetical protein QOK29_4210 [Rhodospirillaceae bacterium]|nr:hypothetical protein [Rhodospirillaceae bacterium]
MKILFVTISLDAERGGGTAERTRHLALTMARQGCRCTVAAIEGTSWRQAFEEAGIRSWITGSIGRRFPLPLLNIRRLWQEIGSAEIIHVTGYWNLLSAATCLSARLRRTPYVLCAAGEFASIDRPRPFNRLFHALLGRPMIAGAASLVAITELEREEIRTKLHLSPDRIVVVPNGVEDPGIADTPRQIYPALPAGKFVLFMGRLAPIKGPDLLLEAFGVMSHLFPDIDLVIAGPDFGMRAELECRCRDLGLEQRVKFIGFIDQETRLEAYRRAALLVIPSRSEAMSLVALEAGVVGTPVLLTDRCGFDEIAAIGGGMVVRPVPQDIGNGLTALLSRMDELPAMGERLRRMIRETYSWPAVANRLRAHLESLIA